MFVESGGSHLCIHLGGHLGFNNSNIENDCRNEFLIPKLAGKMVLFMSVGLLAEKLCLPEAMAAILAAILDFSTQTLKIIAEMNSSCQN